MTKSLKDCTDEEIVTLFRKALEGIRKSESRSGIVRVIVSGGKVVFLNVEKPLM